MTNINTDALAEAYTAVNEIATKMFYDSNPELSNDTYEFLRNIATQINLYRVAIYKK
jgi:hypothetical protein